MKESYIEGLATHDGPESCAGTREGAGEALTGGSAGRVLSREISQSRTPTLLTGAEGHMPLNDKASSGTVLRGRRPLACTETPCARTGRSSVCPPRGWAGRVGKAGRPYADDERAEEVGQARSTDEAAEQGQWYGCGGGGGKEPGQGEGGRAKHAPDAEPDTACPERSPAYARQRYASASASKARAECGSSARSPALVQRTYPVSGS
jgi:hypothetical protein